jgi:hypothetical protein
MRPARGRARLPLMFGRRPDGSPVRDLSVMRRFMPFVSPRRNGSLVYFLQAIDAEPGLAFLERLNAARPPDRPATYFHLVLRAIALALAERPRLNRFVAGGRLWQRDGVWMTFSAKRAFAEDAPLITVKRRFDADASLGDMIDSILDRLGAGRRGERGRSDSEMELLLRLPAPVVRLVLRLARSLDGLGLLPRAMIEPDPLFTSAFVANLGSVGLGAGYHHLWEWGNCGIFCVIGRIAPDAAGRRHLELKWSYDERVDDGFYAAGSLELVRERLEQPEKLS